jgi:hypothetical protein
MIDGPISYIQAIEHCDDIGMKNGSARLHLP